MGLFSRRKEPAGPALREMPVAPGVGKVRAHAGGGKIAIRYDTVKGPPASLAFERMMGLSVAEAEALSKRAWEQGAPFREYTPEPKEGEPQGAPRAVKRLDIGERVSVLAVESPSGGSLARAMPLYWTDLTHTCEPNWAKRFQDRAAAWVEGNTDSPAGVEPLGFAALDFAWHGSVYLRGAAMPLEIAAVAQSVEVRPAPREERISPVVHPGGRAGDPDEFNFEGTILELSEARYEGGAGLILKLQVRPVEWIDLWVRGGALVRTPKAGEGVRSRASLIGLWAGQRTADLAVG